MDSINFSRLFNIAAGIAVILAILIAIYLTKEFLTTILLSVIIVYILKPVYATFFKLTRRNRVSSFLVILIVAVLILVFLLVIADILLTEISNLQKSGALSRNWIIDTILGLEMWTKSFLPAWIYSYMLEVASPYAQKVSDIPVAIASFIFPIIQDKLNSFVSNLPLIFAQLIIIVFLIYYILVDGKSFIIWALDLLPSENRGIIQVFLFELNSIYTALFTVYFTTSLLSGVFAAIGFSLLGIRYPIILGAIVAFFTFMPMLGPPLVFIPLALYYLLLGDVLRFLVLLIFGTVVLMIIPENIIRPHLAMKSAQIHPAITLLAYTAPIFVVGIMGVFIGPAIYGFLLAVFRAAVTIHECPRNQLGK